MNKKSKIRKPKKNSGAWKLIVFIMIILLLTTIAVFVISALNYKPSAHKDDTIPFETLNHDEENEQDNSESDEVKPKKSSTGKYVRSADDFYTFLLLGKDSIAMNTDVIMLMSFNITDNEVAIMQIPRDTYIEHDGTPYKINALFASLYMNAKYKGDKDPIETGMKQFVEALQKSLNVKIDYHAMLYLDGFRNIIDTIGGVDIDIPFNMRYNDPEQNLYINLAAGQTTLTGSQAEQFIRFRSNYIEGDIGRVNAQKIFMTALIKQLKSNVTISKIPKLTAEIINNVTTSMSVNDMIYFAKKSLNIDLSNAVMFTMPGTDARADVDSGAWYFIMHRADTLNLINRYFNVYTEKITDSIFDINQVFNAEYRSHINRIYKTPASEDVNGLINTLDDIDENGVHIPLLR